ncbi:MAG: YiiD C-terminal domain-containing protein [Bdellovibrionales bacterium]|nr:YiiD C-terminal domain-containing protein [Bdellovibrionales bacterium]
MTHIEKLTEKISNYIPLTKSMNLKVVSIEDQSVELFAPLEANKNHMNSAFGGSLYTVAVLSCWGLTEEILEVTGIIPKYTMIKSGHIDYLKPVRGDFAAKSHAHKQDIDAFLLGLSRKQLARIQMTSEIFYNGDVCARLVGEFVTAL